jgi:hypothetical protein
VTAGGEPAEDRIVVGPTVPLAAVDLWRWMRDGRTWDALVGRIRDRAVRMQIQYEDLLARARAAHAGIVAHLDSAGDGWTRGDYQHLAEQRPDLLPALLALHDGDFMALHTYAWETVRPGDEPC